MGGCMSRGDAGRSSSTERLRSSRIENPRRSRDFIRDRANSSRDASSDPTRPYAWNHEQIEEKIELTCTQAIERGKRKMQRYQEEAKRYQKEDRDTLEEFKNAYRTTICEGKPNSCVYFVRSENYPELGVFENIIDINSGKIIGDSNHKQNTNDLDLSEIVYNQVQLIPEKARNPSGFDFKCWFGRNIRNADTLHIVDLFFPKEIGEDRLVKERKKTFQAGTDGFIALAGTETAQSKFYMLAQHPKAFKGKQVRSITVQRLPREQINIDYEIE